MSYWSSFDFQANGLIEVGDAWDEGLGYEFDYFGVWKTSDGKLYWGVTSGCSCNSPWDDVESLADLETGSIAQCHATLDAWSASAWKANSKEASAADLHLKLAQLTI